MVSLFNRLMLMYRRFLKNFKFPQMSSSNENCDNGYYLPVCDDCPGTVTKSGPSNLKLIKYRSNSLVEKPVEPMNILLISSGNSYESQNIHQICKSLNIKYNIAHCEADAISSISKQYYHLIIVDEQKSNTDLEVHFRPIAMNIKTHFKSMNLKLILYHDRPPMEFSHVWETGFDEQWFKVNEQSTLKGHLESYLRNQYYKEVRLKSDTLVFNVFDKFVDSIEILNKDFSIEIVNSTFQKTFKTSLKDVKGNNWFKFHEVSDAKEEAVIHELNTRKSWEGVLTHKSDPHSDNQNNMFAIMKPLDSDENHYIVTISTVRSEQSYSFHSFERESTTASLTRNRDTFLTSQQVSIDSPILKIMKIINSIQELSNPIINHQLQRIIEILSSKDLFITTVDALKADKISSNLIDGLLSNHATIFAQTENRRHSSSLTKRRQTRVNSEVIQDHITQVLAKINKMPEVPENEETGVVDVLLESFQDWSFDILQLEKLTDNKPLRYIGMKVFAKFDLGSTLNIDSGLFQNWLYVIETNYNDSNCYHNSTHAADVLQSSVWFLERERINEIFDSYDDVISIIAAIIHDLGHPGRTNPFLINSNHNLAVLYNDIAVLENHHASFAFKVTLKDERINIFKNLNRDDYRSIRHGIIDAVLATEMAKHFEHLTKFANNIVSVLAPNQSVNTGNSSETSISVLNEPENKAIIRRMLIKCSDVNNPTRPFHLCREWAKRISEEYFNQTDEEISKGLPVVMPQFNRQTCDIPKSQIYFIDIFLKDMFSVWNDFTDITELLTNLNDNKEKWTNLSEKVHDSAKTLSENSKEQLQ